MNYNEKILYLAFSLLVVVFLDMVLTQYNLNNGRSDVNFIVSFFYNLNNSYGLTIFLWLKVTAIFFGTTYIMLNQVEGMVPVYGILLAIHVIWGLGSNFIAYMV